VLFVHGSGGHHAAWWQQVAALSPSYSVITVDLRGFGNSRWESAHDARNFPGDIIAVLDAIATDGGPSRAVLFGQSIGVAAAPRAALDRLLTPEFRAQRPDLAFLFRQMGTFNTAKMQDLRNLNTDGPTVEELASAPFPLMLLAGEKDAVLSPATVRRAGELLPSTRVEVVTGAPHSMYWETPQLFNDVVASFLRDVAAG
jgi:3-oxoadipate enol-lactonase